MNYLFNNTVAALAGVLMFVAMTCNIASADAVINYDNGYSLNVPDGWVVDVRPEGFNSLLYDAQTNPQGKLEGWGGWPWYDLYLEVNYNCHPGELIISPGFCPPQPEFYLTPECPTCEVCEDHDPRKCKDKKHKH